MSERLELAHDYYSHAVNRRTATRIGLQYDEFRVSYAVAKNAPNLSEIYRYNLIQDAISRAQEAGISIKYND